MPAYRRPSSRRPALPWPWLASALALIALLWLLAPVLGPFLAAAMLAYMTDPLVDRLERLRLSRTAATVWVLAGLCLLGIALLAIVLPLALNQGGQLLARLPAMLQHAQLRLQPLLLEYAGWSGPLDIGQLTQLAREHLGTLQSATQRLVPSLWAGGTAALAWLGNLALIPLVLFYLLRDWHVLLDRIADLIPRRWLATVTSIATASDAVLGQFLRGQLLVMALMSALYCTGLLAIGLDAAIPLGLLSGLLCFIPYVGMAIGLVLSTLAAALQFDSWQGILLVWAVFGCGQLLEGMVITPWLVGDSIGLHPVVVIFALLAGGQLFGFAGIMLALPVSACLLVILRHVRQRYVTSRFYRQGG
jgi:predicted PurR-regulated permease PerM